MLEIKVKFSDWSKWGEMRKPLLFGTGLLLCLVLYVAGTASAVAHEVDSASGNCDCIGSQQEVKRSERAGSKSAGAGLRSVLPRKYPRRTDIPEALLIVMLALIGVVVIARRDVSGRERSVLPEKGLKTER